MAVQIQPEIIQETEQRTSSERHRLVRAAQYAGALAIGGVVGLGIASNLPTNVEFAPGLSAKIELQADRTTLDLSPGTIVENANLTAELPVLGPIGAKITPDLIDTPKAGTSLEQYALLFSDPESVKGMVVGEMASHIGIGAAKGAVAGAGLLGLGIYFRTQNSRKMNGYEKRLEANSEAQAALINDSDSIVLQHLKDEANVLERKVKRSKYIHESAPVLAAISLAVPLMLSANEAQDSEPVRNNVTVLDERITDSVPMLKSTLLYGNGGVAFNDAVGMILNQKDRVDTFWKNAATNLHAEVETMKQSGELDYFDNKYVTPYLHLSDIHCNLAFNNEFLGSLITEFQTPVVAITGDSFTNNNTRPYERDCISSINKQLLKVTEKTDMRIVAIHVIGNHDPEDPTAEMNITATDKNGQEYTFVTTLDEDTDYKATVAGITFVGVSDPTRTVEGPTLPLEPLEQKSLLTERGEELQEAACEVSEETGIKPIALAHRENMLYATIASGCAQQALSGHLHSDSEHTLYQNAAGETTLAHTVGSAVGASENFTVYAAPKVVSNSTVYLYDQITDEVSRTIDITVRPDGAVDVQSNELPIDPKLTYDDARLRGFLHGTSIATLDKVPSRVQKPAMP